MKKPNNLPIPAGFLRPAQAARYCSISPRHLANLTQQRLVKSSLLGKRCRLFKISDLDAAIARFAE